MADTSEHRTRSVNWRRLGILAISLVSVSIILGGWLLFTESGLRWAIGTGAQLSGGIFTVRQVHGRLVGNPLLEGVEVNTPGLRISVDQVGFNLVPAGIWRTSLTLGTVSIAGVSITMEEITDSPPRTPTTSGIYGLPMGIDIGHLTIDHMTIQLPGSRAPVAIRAVEFSGSIDRQNLLIRHLEIRDQMAEISAIGSISMDGDHALDVGVRWSINTPGMPRIQGRGSLDGTLTDLHIDQETTSPLEAAFKGTLSTAEGVNSWSASVTIYDLHPALTFLDDKNGSVKGSFTGGGTFSSFSLRGDLSVSGLPGLGDETVKGEITGLRDADRWELQNLDVSVTGTTASFRTRGYYDPGVLEGTLVLESVWEGVVWPLDVAEPFLTFPSGRMDFNLEGTTYRATAKGSFSLNGYGPGPFHLKAEGKESQITVQEASFSLGTATLRASGSLSDRWDGNWRLTVADLGGFWASGEGKLDILGTVQGERASPVLDARLTARDLLMDVIRVEALEGTLRTVFDKEVAAELNLSVSGLERGDLRIDHVLFTGEGSAGSHSLRTTVQIGTMSAKARLEGGVLDRQWEGVAEVEGLGGLLTASGKLAWADSLTWSGSLRAEDLHPARLWEILPEEVDAIAAFSGSYHEGSVETDVVLSRMRGLYRSLPFDGKAGLGIRGDTFQIDEMDLTWGTAHVWASGSLTEQWTFSWDLDVPQLTDLLEGMSGRITASGTVSGTRESPSLDIALKGGDLSFGLIATDEVSATVSMAMTEPFPFDMEVLLTPVAMGSFRTGEILLTGRGSQPDHELHLSVVSPEGSDTSLAIKGGFGQGAWEGSMTTDIVGGNLEALGALNWEGGLSWRAAIGGYDLDPGTLSDQWQGNLSTEITVEGSLLEGGLNNSVSVEDLSGTLRGQIVRGSARILSSPGDSNISIPDLRLGSGTLAGTLEISNVVKGSWVLDLPDLSEIVSTLRGSLRSSGKIQGAPSSPSIMASLVAANLGGETWSLESLSLKAQMPDFGSLPGSISAHASQLSLGGLKVQTASLAAAGTSGKQKVTLSAGFSEGAASAVLEGGIEDGSWRGALESMDLDPPSRARLSLERTVQLEISPAEGNIPPTCVVSNESRLCAEASWSVSGGTASLQIHRLPLSLFTLGSGNTLDLNGSLDGTLKGGVSEGHWWGSSRLSVPAASVLFEAGYGRPVAFNLREALLSATLGNNGLEGSFQAGLGVEGSRDHFLGTFSLPGMSLPHTEGFSYLDQPIQCRLEAQLSEMGFIQAFTADVSEPAGLFTAALDIKGTLGTPVTGGFVSLKDGSAGIPLLGLSLKKVEGRLNADQTGRLTLEAAADSGSGRLQIQGSAGNLSTMPMAMEFRIKGENVTVARTPVIRLVISPELTLTAEDDLFSLTGTVRVPEASFTPVEVVSSQSVSPDVVVIDTGPVTTPKQPLKVRGDLTFIFGDRVSFDGFGLTGHVSGSVRIIDEPEMVTAATGQLAITDGQYRAFGQKLTIERGKLNFSGGGVENPGLDIRAVRLSGDILAGVQVGGTLMEPDVSLFSDPPMEQADALSYLLLGKPLKRTSGEEGKALSTAALSLGLNRGESLAKRIGSTFGFDEVSVQTAADIEQSALVVGRYLTPSVYVRYGVGIFQEFNLFQFGYQISDRLLLQGESGEETSTDLLYTIEK